jgi:hypothetical protein
MPHYGCSIHGLRRTVVAACPFEDQSRPATWKNLTPGGAQVAMLLTICHDDAQFLGVLPDRVLPPVHRATVEDSHTRHVTSRVPHTIESALPIDRLAQAVGPLVPERLGRFGR